MASILEQKSLQRSGCESLDLHYQLFLIDFEVHRDAGGAVRNLNVSLQMLRFQKYSPFDQLTGIEGPDFFERYLGAALLVIIALIHKCFHLLKFYLR